MTDDDIPEEFSEEALYERLDYFLLNFGTDRSLLCVSELDGFFTALGCASGSLLPDFWLPAIWGADEDQPVWENADQEEEFLSLILLMYVDTVESIINGELQPVFLENIQDVDDEGAGNNEVLVEEWCIGFMRGALLTGLPHSADKDFIDEVLAPARLFGTEAGWKKLEDMSHEETRFWQELLEPCVMRLAQHNHPEIELVEDDLPRVIH